ncbi:MAG: transporter substrate-binding domain-containing protein [Bacillota bacterium]
MRLFAAIIAVLAGITPKAALAGQGDVPTLRVAGDEFFPPYEFVTEQGVYTGFNVDLMNAVAIELGINIEFVPLPWAQAREALEQGKVDAIQGMKYSPERDKAFDFSEPYLTSSLAIFVRKDTMDISGLPDLSGHRVAVQHGDIAFDVVNPIQGVSLVVFENQKAALESLLAGEVDAYVGNRLAGIYMTQRKMRTGDVKIVGSPIDPAPYCVAVREGDRRVQELFNRGLQAVKKSGTYDKIYRKWFGEEIEPPAASVKRAVRVLGGILVALAIAATLVINWNRSLRKQVAIRTAELARTSALQSLILDNSFNAVVALDCSGRIVLSNRVAAEIVGASPQELHGAFWWQSPIARILDQAMVLATLGSGKVFRDKEVRIEGGDGQRVIHFNLGPLCSKNGIEGAVLVYRDVTSLKKVEEAEATKSKMEAMAQLIGGIAHEIRNPLTAIKSFVEMLPHKYDLPEFREQIVRYVPSEIERVNSIIQELMEYARPRPPLKQEFKLSELVHSVVSMMAYEASKRKALIKTDVPDWATCYADKNHVRQVLINLVLNALEALTNPGEVRITACNCQDGMVCLCVEDSGIGIPRDQIPRVIEPFYTSKPGGTGLGLSVSYKLLKENGGTLEIQSTLGVGTRVAVFLPTTSHASDGGTTHAQQGSGTHNR